MLATVAGDSATALSLLSTAAAALAVCDRPAVRGDTPAALGALVALHRGEPELAGPLLDRALALDLGGPVHRRRHLLLRAWCALAAGDGATARALRASAGEAGPETVEPRDELVAVALDVALARRAGDVRGLLDLWARAREALVNHPVDLYVLLFVGELALAAARLGEQGWVAPHLADGDSLLTSLGEPALWSTPWRWYGLQYAIATEQPALAEAHATALAAAARPATRPSPPPAPPARGCGCWPATSTPTRSRPRRRACAPRAGLGRVAPGRRGRAAHHRPARDLGAAGLRARPESRAPTTTDPETCRRPGWCSPSGNGRSPPSSSRA